MQARDALIGNYCHCDESSSSFSSSPNFPSSSFSTPHSFFIFLPPLFLLFSPPSPSHPISPPFVSSISSPSSFSSPSSSFSMLMMIQRVHHLCDWSVAGDKLSDKKTKDLVGSLLSALSAAVRPVFVVKRMQYVMDKTKAPLAHQYYLEWLKVSEMKVERGWIRLLLDQMLLFSSSFLFSTLLYFSFTCLWSNVTTI